MKSKFATVQIFIAALAWASPAFADSNEAPDITCSGTADQHGGRPMQIRIQVTGSAYSLEMLVNGVADPEGFHGVVHEVTGSAEDQALLKAVWALSKLPPVRNRTLLISYDGREKIGGLIVNLDDLKRSYCVQGPLKFSNLACVVNR